MSTEFTPIYDESEDSSSYPSVHKVIADVPRETGDKISPRPKLDNTSLYLDAPDVYGDDGYEFTPEMRERMEDGLDDAPESTHVSRIQKILHRIGI